MFLDEVRDDFCIRIRNKCVALCDKLLSELLPVLNDAVVHDPNLPVFAPVWMRVFRCWLTMGCPPKVCDAAFAAEFLGDFFPQFSDCPGSLYDPALRRKDTSGVIAAILERDKSLQEHLRSVFPIRSR